MTSVEPLLSVVTVTYNHAPYISRMIESVLAQEVDFPMEFIIADDCSTDGTLEICREYERRRPDLIRVLSASRNSGAVFNERRAFGAARGRYIATCEGDDWWTDSGKLRRQVNFLEEHPDFSVCFHRYRRYYAQRDVYEDDGISYLFGGSPEEGMELSMTQFMHRWSTQYLTMVFRRDCYDTSLPDRYRYFRDTHQVYHLMLRGRCYLFSFVGGVYNITNGGVYSVMSGLEQSKKILAVDRELWRVNRDRRWREMCAVVMQDMINSYGAPYAFRVFFLKPRFARLLNNLRHVCSKG